MTDAFYRKFPPVPNLLEESSAPLRRIGNPGRLPLFGRPKFKFPLRGGSIRDPLGRNRGDFEPREIPIQNLGRALEAARSLWRDGASLSALFGDEPFEMHGSIGRAGQNRPGDVFKLQTLLHRLGYRDAMPTDGPTGFFGSFDHEPIMAFQRDHGLMPDGAVDQGGPTARALAQYADPTHPAAAGEARGMVQVRAHQRGSADVRAYQRHAPGQGGGGTGGGGAGEGGAGGGRPDDGRPDDGQPGAELPREGQPRDGRPGSGDPGQGQRRRRWSDEPPPPMQSPVPNPTTRTDAAGDGNPRAPRRRSRPGPDGQPATHTDEHMGVDIDVTPGETVASPVEGVVVDFPDPYRSNPERKDKMQGVTIETKDGHRVTVYYVKPREDLVHGTRLRPGDPIGQAQDVRDVHGPGMDPHIHVELRDRSGAYKDPSGAMGVRPRPKGRPPQR